MCQWSRDAQVCAPTHSHRSCSSRGCDSWASPRPGPSLSETQNSDQRHQHQQSSRLQKKLRSDSDPLCQSPFQKENHLVAAVTWRPAPHPVVSGTCLRPGTPCTANCLRWKNCNCISPQWPHPLSTRSPLTKDVAGSCQSGTVFPSTEACAKDELHLWEWIAPSSRSLSQNIEHGTLPQSPVASWFAWGAHGQTLELPLRIVKQHLFSSCLAAWQPLRPQDRQAAGCSASLPTASRSHLIAAVSLDSGVWCLSWIKS